MKQVSGLGAALALVLGLVGCSNNDQETPRERAPRQHATGQMSCYSMVKLEDFARDPERKIFVFVDQTTVLDDYLVRKLNKSVQDFLGDEGGAFEIARFSAFSKNSYASSIGEGTVETYNIDKADEAGLSVRSLEKLRECLKQERPFMLGKARDAINKAVSLEEKDFTNSEVLASMVRFSRLVRESGANEKVFIIASDMLEHSQASSFYKSKGIRLIEPSQELENARKLDLVGDFSGARVYVIGGGLLPPSSGAEAGRNPEALKRLTDFWTQWVEASNGELVEFGAPDLMSSLAKRERDEPERGE